MNKHFFRKSLSLLLVGIMLLSIMPLNLTAGAADSAPKVEIVSFMRGAQTDLRSSELLEARVTGYDGNVQELTYEWTNTLGTYLYVYNSHNMYYINGTDGEVEIYNSQIPSSTNMASRSYKDTFKGTGYCWAAIYGSNSSGTGGDIQDYNAYSGTISVTVKDKNGNIIGSDSHTGTVTKSGFGWWPTYTYSGIIDHSLKSDMDDVTIGIFEGDKRNVKDLLGESAILHITCVESTVNSGKITSGENYISLTKENGDYYITGNKASESTTGDATVELTIKKDFCKFHEDTTATATTTAYVFKKPTTSTTAYTLTLTGNLDKRCTYYIGGQQGEKTTDENGNEIVVFKGLTPNTRYMVEVKAEYKDEKNITRYAYAYVYDTTKPIYNGTVEVYLNGTYDSATQTATGTKVNLEDVTSYSTIFVKDTDSDEFIELAKKKDTIGTYSSVLDDGSYNLYYKADVSTKIDDQIMVMNQADRTRYLFYNSVEYKDGETQLGVEYYPLGSSVTTRPALAKDGYVFAGWKDESGKIYPANSNLTTSISAPYVLEAVWTEGVDVTVNIVLDHTGENNGIDIDTDFKFNVSFDLMHRVSGTTSDFTDVLAPVTVYDKGILSSDYVVEKTANDEDIVTKTVYTAKYPNLVNVAKGMEYSVEVAKSSYELMSVETEYDAEGNVIITATLKFSPKNTDLVFDVELDQLSKDLIKEYPQYKPQAVNVKVLYWNDEYKTWQNITQHQDTFVTVYLDENGESTGGSYPVWNYNNNNEPYYFRIKVVSYVLQDGTVIETTDVADNKDVQYVTADERYLATIFVGSEGKNPEQSVTSLTGSYFENNIQKGSLLAEINIETFNVTFQPDGGKFADGTTKDKTETNQIVVPELAPFTPVKDGGYVFDGWYLVDKNGNITEETVNSGDALLEDIILRAKWKSPLTVEGLISVAGYYYLNNEVHIIHEADRTHAVTVLLQRIFPNGYAETIDSQLVDVSYSDLALIDDNKPVGFAEYAFKALPDDGTVYRILVANPNYTVSYQNEPESINNSSDYSLYNANDFMAEFGSTEPLVADVNALLVFTPTNFKLVYEVIASSIGEGFRPSNTEILVLYNDLKSGVNPQGWPVISQMVMGENLKGNETAVNSDGIGVDSEPVWILMPDGTTLYDYSVLLKDYTINGEETQFDAVNAPFFAYYNGSARYSAREDLTPEHQTQLLTVELQPKRYLVTFNQNFEETEEDHLENFDKYTVSVDGKRVYRTGHTWSYETDFSDAVPTRQGYKFLGWYDKDGNKVTSVDASVHENITLTAKWEELFKVTFHANNEDIADDIFRVYFEKGSAPEGAFVLNDNNTVSSFYDIPEFDYETHNKYIFKGWYLDKDNNNNDRPVKWSDVYTGNTDVYAHWIETGNVAKDAEDPKVIPYENGMYPGYDLVGVQIRDVEKDDADHYGEEGTGLRFVTVLSESVYDKINTIKDRDGKATNNSKAEYGYVVSRTDTAEQAADYYGVDKNDFRLEYNGTNVNGVDTSSKYKFVQNVKCSGVPDHQKYDDYRLYTTVITYKGLEGDALAAAQSTEITARSYIRYYDANGLCRTHYNNYTGTVNFGGCSLSFTGAVDSLNR